MIRFLKIGFVGLLSAVLLVGGATSVQAGTSGFTAVPTTGGKSQTVTLAGTTQMTKGSAIVRCALTGQQDQHFWVTVVNDGDTTGTINIVALPASGPWTCGVYPAGLAPSATDTFGYTYTGVLSSSAFSACVTTPTEPAVATPAEQPTLAETGNDPASVWLPLTLIVLFLASGISLAAVGHAARRKTATWAIPFLIVALVGAGIAALPPTSAQANGGTGATPAVTPWITDVSSLSDGTQWKVTSLTQWVDVTGDCGTLSYQWRTQKIGETNWVDVGSASASPTELTAPLDVGAILLEATLTNTTGSTVVQAQFTIQRAV